MLTAAFIYAASNETYFFEDWILRVGAVFVALGAVAFFLMPLFRRLRRTNLRVEEFLDDWNGEPARPGVKARPGVMARMATIEDGMDKAANERRLLSLRLSHVEETIKDLG